MCNLISSPAALAYRPKAWDQCASRSAAQLPGHTGPKNPAGCVPQSVAWGPHMKPRVGEHPDEWPTCKAKDRCATLSTVCLPLATMPEARETEHLPTSPCTQSPAGPTRSLGGRQNAQQRGAAGLRETAVPGKTRLSRGLNHPERAPRAPSI